MRAALNRNRDCECQYGGCKRHGRRHQGTRGNVPITIASTSALAAITAQMSRDQDTRRRRGVGSGEGLDMATDLSDEKTA